MLPFNIRYKITGIFLTLFLLSCETTENISGDHCSTNDPFGDINWLKEQKDVMEMNMGIAGGQIIRYLYHGNYVFLIDDCYQCPDALITVKNCEGEVVCEFGGIDGRNTCPDFTNEATDSTMLLDLVNH